MEPIAITGLSCRFPHADGPNAFWTLLTQGQDAVTEVPPDRWDKFAFFDKFLRKPGKMNSIYGGFLSDIDAFDPDFFGFNDREASYMDPQQRLFLEVGLGALENAGLSPTAVSGCDAGVFVGVYRSEYQRLAHVASQKDGAYAPLGDMYGLVANRFSYFLNLRGPSIAIDSASSSSLVAVSQACLHLQAGDCELAFAGGVNLILDPFLSVAYAQAGMLSGSGRCRSFDLDADGYVRAEGCGVVVLRLLSEAVRRGERILALIHGYAVNQDGASKGITAPDQDAQRRLVEKALSRAGISPDQLSFIEGHGSGTPLGDATELAALTQVLQAGKSRTMPCFLGSVKSNLGHLEAAAGIAGLIKCVLALFHRSIPANLHFSQWKSPGPSLFVIPSDNTPWPASDSGSFAGVSSYGIGGTNAHVILGDAPAAAHKRPARSCFLLCLAAASPARLCLLIASTAHQLRHVALDRLGDFCFANNLARSSGDSRCAFLISDPVSGAESLLEYGRCSPLPCSKNVALPIAFDLKPVAPFPASHPLGSFPNALADCFAEAEPIWQDLRHESLHAPNPDQLLLKALMLCRLVGLARLWLSWGIRPRSLFLVEDSLLAGLVFAEVIRLDAALSLLVVDAPNPPLCLEPPRFDLHLGASVFPAFTVLPPRLLAENFSNQVRRPCSKLVLIPAAGDAVSCWLSFQSFLLDAFLAGASIDWYAFEAPFFWRHLFLDPYPFQRHSCWLEPLKPTGVSSPPLPTPSLALAPPSCSQRESDLCQAFPNSPLHQRKALIKSFVIACFARLSNGPDLLSSDSNRPLKDLGMDSFMGQELTRALETLMGFSLEASLVFNYPSIDALCLHLSARSVPVPDAGASAVSELDPMDLISFWSAMDIPLPVVLDDVSQDQAFSQEIDLLLRLTAEIHA